MNYTHLNVKSHYSLLNSLLKIDDIIELCEKHGYDILSVCDINSTFGLSEMYYKAKGKKVLLGVELIFDNDSYILYAKNYQGLETIYYLTSLVNSGELTYQHILDNCANLICILNVKSKAYIEYYNNGNTERIIQLRYYFNEVYFIDTFEDSEVRRFCMESNCLPIYGYEIKYDSYNDKKYYDLLKAISYNENYVRDNGGERTYFISYDEVCQSANSEMLDNVCKIIDACNVTIPSEVLIPKYNEDYDSNEYLISLCLKGLQKRLGSISDEYKERLKYELDTICKMGFADYFLIVYDYVKYAKNSGIVVGAGRGSAPGSLVAYVLGITEIDPIKYNLLFERFLNPARVSLPDIDVDFEDTRRDEVVKYIVERYGYNFVGAISTFSTFASKQVIRDCAKAFGKNSVEIKYLTQHINAMSSLKQNYYSNGEFRDLVDRDPSNEMIYQYALRLEGLVRHNSIHAAGVVISKLPLKKRIGVLSGEVVNAIAATMDNIETMGLIKMDILGLRNLSILNNILKQIKVQHGVGLDIYNIDLEDKKVLDIFSSGDTTGIFQFESNGMKSLLRKLKPKKFMDLASANALHRPGPMENIDEFVARAHGKRFSYIDSSLEHILDETYGIIVFQEQIMQVANKVANFSYSEADVLRVAMSKKDVVKLSGQKEKFIKKSLENGYDIEVIEIIFESILKFANYGFNKAHAVSYSLIGYILGYMKCYYPDIFNVALMNNSISNHLKVFEYINECRVKGMEVVGVNINKSEQEFCIKDGRIVMPLNLVKGVNSTIAKSILDERNNGEFKSFHDFIIRLSKHNVKQSVLENLVYANAFSSVENGNSKKSLIQAIPNLIDMLSFDSDGLFVSKEFVYTKFEEYSILELVEFERNALGFNFSLHPTSIYTDKMEITTLNVKEYLNRNVSMILYVDGIRKIKTKKGDDMSFVTCSDIYGIIEAVCFPRIYEKTEINKGDVIYVYGKVEYRNDRVQLIMENIKVRR